MVMASDGDDDDVVVGRMMARRTSRVVCRWRHHQPATPERGRQPLGAQRKSCYSAEGIEETTALVAAEMARNLLVYYFIVVHQSAELGREEDVACDTDRPTKTLPGS